MSPDPDNPIPLPPASAPAPMRSPAPFHPPASPRWPVAIEFAKVVPLEDLEPLVERICAMILDDAIAFDEAIVREFAAGVSNEYWGSTAGREDDWSTDLESAIDVNTERIIDAERFSRFAAALATAVFRPGVLETALSHKAYVDAEGFVVSIGEVRERLRAVIMGEEPPSRNAWAWLRPPASPA